MGNDDKPPPPQLPPPSPERKDSVADMPPMLLPDHGLSANAANPDSSSKQTTLPPLDQNSRQSLGPSIAKNGGSLPPTKPAERHQKAQRVEDGAELKAQIQQLNDRLRHFEEPGRARRGSESEQGAESMRGRLPQQNHLSSADKELLAAGASMAEFEFNARMEAANDRHYIHHSGHMAYNAIDDEDDLEETNELEEEATSDDSEESDATPLNPSQLNYVSWDVFRSLGQFKGSPFAIDVLVGDPEVKVTPMFPRLGQEPPSRATGVKAARPAKDEPGSIKRAPTIPVATPQTHGQRSTKMPGKAVSRAQGRLPERIRINSPAIIHLLHKICDMGEEDDRPDAEPEESPERSYSRRSSRRWRSSRRRSSRRRRRAEERTEPDPLLMMEPFRALVHYKHEIRNWKAKLEAEVQEEPGRTRSPEPHAEAGSDSGKAKTVVDTLDEDGNTSRSRSAAPPGSQNNLDPILNTKQAVDDVTRLVEFIDSELEGRIAYLASKDCQRVAFSDIWLLFKPGELVLGKNGKQAYRVINSEYPTHCMKVPSPREYWMYGAKARLEGTPIQVQCVHIDFDGEKIGPVVQTFSFHRFEGEKPVRSLDIIPLRLLKDSKELQKTLIERGSTFLEACSTGRHGIPMHYSGHILGTKEEVDSQVVIDFEEAFAAHDGGSRDLNHSTLTTAEQITLEVLAQEFKKDILKKSEDLLILKHSDPIGMTTRMIWKPIIKDVDVQENTAEEVDVDDSSSVSGSEREVPQIERLTKKNRGCIPECCADELVYHDAFVEHRRSNEFLQDQFRRDQGTPSLTISSRLLGEAMEDQDFIGESEKLIVTYRVFGFIMRSRKWAQLDLAFLGPAKGENTFDLLVLPKGHRTMVESLVTQHYLDMASASDEADEVDIVRGKGKGLIILLHGAPGVGKTTTAECVANYFQKPLFQITCGDLGSTADVVERRLEENFALASRWGCILLIDEADVFLEARQTENFDRNSLVAVFLRTLEYYTGILFLTTNRVGTFDEAFTSRIHISLYYPPLDAKSTLAVFKVNLDRIEARFARKKERGVAELTLYRRSIKRFILEYYDYALKEEARWNGRQIRNACQTALALAEFEAQKAANPGVAGGKSVMDIVAKSNKMIHVKMKAEHFVHVAKAYLAFIRYLRNVHGTTPAQRAKRHQLRHDQHGLGEHNNGGAGLLASRQQRGDFGGGGGVGRQRKPPVQKQGMGRKGMQGASLGDDDAWMNEFLGEDGDGVEDLHGAGLDEDEMLQEDEVGHLGGELADEEEEYLEHEDDVAFGNLEDEEEDEEAGEEDEDGNWDQELEDDNAYIYEAQPKAFRPQPAGGGRGSIPRGRRGQQPGNYYKAAGTGNPRAEAGGRGKGVAAAPMRSAGPQVKVTRGDPHGLGRGRGRGGGAGAAGRGRGARATTEYY